MRGAAGVPRRCPACTSTPGTTTPHAWASPCHPTRQTTCYSPADKKLQKLSFARKLLLLTTAATSGCETNLAAAWDLLRPCLFPELPAGPYGARNHYVGLYQPGYDSDTTAVRQGHVHLVGWLVRHGWSLHPNSTLMAAARLCDLASLQSTYELLGLGAQQQQHQLAEAAHAQARSVPWEGLLNAAVSSPTPDWRAKAVWVWQAGGSSCRLRAATAAAAATTGELDRLQWLQVSGRGVRHVKAMSWGSRTTECSLGSSLHQTAA